MYITKVQIAKSKIDGDGVFTEVDISKDTKVWVFKEGYDQRLTNTEFQSLSSAEKDHLSHTAYFSPWSNMWVFPPTGDPAEYTNHSSHNNLTVIFDSVVSPEPYFIANRDIAQGEELTNNYHEFDEITRQTMPEWAKLSHYA